ncbi:MAG: 6-phospho-3-hexuloisomerase [Pirellulaceae bacterium]|nr:6-phospho-3-hexuloisomerase [Pirellulaceae bacterium]
MFQRQNQQLVLDKISEVLDATDEAYADQLTALMDGANRIFIAGAGRSKLVGNFLAMRLMHGGYAVSVVGEIVTPAVNSGDLLVVISGSGETEQLIAFAKRARLLGATIVLLTAKPDSTIGSLADDVFQIGVPEIYSKVKGMPMGTVFELSTLCFLEALISHIIWEKGVPEEEMRTRHANLE